MRYDDGSWGSGHWAAMILVMVVLFVLLGLLVIWLFRQAQPPAAPRRDAPGPTARAEALLAERFARGEIDEDEFVRRRELLQQTPSG